MTASEALLEDVFKKFGTIKKDGIQVRSNRVCSDLLIYCLFSLLMERQLMPIVSGLVLLVHNQACNYVFVAATAILFWFCGV